MINFDLYTDRLTKICEQLAVKHLEIFGSSLRDDFDPNLSDMDFLYQFEGTENIFKRFMSLKKELEDLFEREVDLLKEDEIKNPFLKEQIAKAPRKILYAA